MFVATIYCMQDPEAGGNLYLAAEEMEDLRELVVFGLEVDIVVRKAHSFVSSRSMIVSILLPVEWDSMSRILLVLLIALGVRIVSLFGSTSRWMVDMPWFKLPFVWWDRPLAEGWSNIQVASAPFKESGLKGGCCCSPEITSAEVSAQSTQRLECSDAALSMSGKWTSSSGDRISADSCCSGSITFGLGQEWMTTATCRLFFSVDTEVAFFLFLSVFWTCLNLEVLGLVLGFFDEEVLALGVREARVVEFKLGTAGVVAGESMGGVKNCSHRKDRRRWSLDLSASLVNVCQWEQDAVWWDSPRKNKQRLCLLVKGMLLYTTNSA